MPKIKPGNGGNAIAKFGIEWASKPASIADRTVSSARSNPTPWASLTIATPVAQKTNNAGSHITGLAGLHSGVSQSHHSLRWHKWQVTKRTKVTPLSQGTRHP